MTNFVEMRKTAFHQALQHYDRQMWSHDSRKTGWRRGSLNVEVG